MKKITSFLMLFLMCFGNSIWAQKTLPVKVSTEGGEMHYYAIKSLKHDRYVFGAWKYDGRLVADKNVANATWYFLPVEGDSGKVIIKNAFKPDQHVAGAAHLGAQNSQNFIIALQDNQTDKYYIAPDNWGNDGWNDANGFANMISNWNNNDGGSRFVFEEVATVPTGVMPNQIKASTSYQGTYYSIQSARTGRYLAFDGKGEIVKQHRDFSDKCYFYFEGDNTAGYSIMNAKGGKLNIDGDNVKLTDGTAKWLVSEMTGQTHAGVGAVYIKCGNLHLNAFGGNDNNQNGIGGTLGQWNGVDVGDEWILKEVGAFSHPIITDVSQLAEGTKYTFVCVRGGLTTNASGLTSTGGQFGVDINSAEQQFALVKNGQDFYLFSVAYCKYINKDGSFSHIPTDKIFFSKNKDNPARFQPSFGLENNNINLGGGNQLVIDHWKTSDDGNQFEIRNVGEIDVKANAVRVLEKKMKEVESAYKKGADWLISDALGYYGQNEGVDLVATYNEVSDFLNTGVQNASLNDVLENIDKIEVAVAGVHFNTPAVNKFYRLQGKASGNYMDASVLDGNNISMKSAENRSAEGSIFFLTDDSKLLTYCKGLFLHGTCGLGGVGAGDVVEFRVSGDQSFGYFTLYTNFSGSKFVFDNEFKVDKNSDFRANCNWAVEPVNSLPVTVSDVKYATLYAPCALQIPAKIKAYTGTVNVQTKNLTLVEVPNGVIPANTAVILVAEEAGNYSFEISTATPAGIANNALAGTVPTKAKVEGDLTLQVVGNTIGMYKYTGNNLKGFKAYLSNEQAAGVNGFRFSFGEATGIEGLAGEQQNEVYYDLNGRRVLYPVHGVFVTGNGQKVYIK